METWRQVPDFPDYEVSDHGRVRSLERKVLVTRSDLGTSYWKSVKPRVLKPILGNGYPCVGLRRDDQGHGQYIHHLVCLIFIGPRPEGYDIMHLDNDKTNNCLSNLRYGTRSENIQQCWDEGRREPAGFCVH